MPSPILRNDVGSVDTVTGTVAIANNAYANSADKMTLDNLTDKALLADFELVPTFGAAPVAGALYLYAVDWTLDGVSAGPNAASSMVARLVGMFSPSPSTANALTTWKMRLNSVPLTGKTDFWVYNGATGQSVAIGWVLKAQKWSPGA